MSIYFNTNLILAVQVRSKHGTSLRRSADADVSLATISLKYVQVCTQLSGCSVQTT